MDSECLFVLVVYFSVVSADLMCKIIFNEINIDGPELATERNQNEFIELKNSCNLPSSDARTLDDFTLVIWKGPATLKQKATVQHVVPLKGYAFNHGSPFFVIGSTKVLDRLRLEANIVSGVASLAFLLPEIEEEKQIKITTRGYLDNGKKRSMALVLYKGPIPLSKGDELPSAKIHSAQIEDALIYHVAGSAKMFIKAFFPDYRLPRVDGSAGIVLKDIGKAEHSEDLSVSYCCSSDRPRWPLGFQRTVMSPGLPNMCTDNAGDYVLSKVGERITKESRCDPAALDKLKKEDSAGLLPTALAEVDLLSRKRYEFTETDVNDQGTPADTITSLPAPDKLPGKILKSSAGLEPRTEVSPVGSEVSDALNKFRILLSVLGGVGGLVLLGGLVGGYIYIRRQAHRKKRFNIHPAVHAAIDDDEVF